MAEIEGAYEATAALKGETIVIVDDLVRSGTTLATAAGVLRAAGTGAVIGVVATKTARGES